MSEEDADKLFITDVDTSGTGTAGEKGTSPGFILCEEFIEINYGHIRVKSKNSKGSKFSFTLPLT